MNSPPLRSGPPNHPGLSGSSRIGAPQIDPNGEYDLRDADGLWLAKVTGHRAQLAVDAGLAFAKGTGTVKYIKLSRARRSASWMVAGSQTTATVRHGAGETTFHLNGRCDQYNRKVGSR